MELLGATGSLALEHNDYVSSTWPGNARFNFFSATCADVSEEQCDILQPKYLQRFHAINEQVKKIVIDGADISFSAKNGRSRSVAAGDRRRPTLDHLQRKLEFQRRPTECEWLSGL
eukprot:g30997.t1